MRWDEFQSDAGAFGDEARGMLERPGVVLVGTIRRDGTPRISPVEPFFWDSELWLAMMWRSQKTADMYRDPRVLVHSVITGREGTEGEAKVRGEAIPERDPDRRSAVCRAIGEALPWKPDPERVELFRIDVQNVALVRYEPEGGQRVALWPVRRRFFRRQTSDTSVGEPEDESTF
jgi:pyridoxamine 5'-phosphate oxidase-like protein